MTNSRLIQRIRSTIYNVREGRLNKEEGFDKIELLMDNHNKLMENRN